VVNVDRIRRKMNMLKMEIAVAIYDSFLLDTPLKQILILLKIAVGIFSDCLPAVFFNGISNKGLGLTKVFIGVVFHLFKAAPTGYFLTRLLRTVKVGERTYHPIKMLLRKLILFNKSMKKV